MKNCLSISERENLETLHKSCKERRKADKIKAILMLDKGYSYQEISSILMLDDSTIRDYYKIYKDFGISELISDNNKGTSKSLTEEQIRRLKIYLNHRIFSTAKEIRDFIENKFYVNYSISGVTNFLHSINFVYKKTKHLPSKANEEKQLEFIDKYEELKQTKNEEDTIWFMDGCHPQHNSIPANCWVEKGKEKPVKANTGRQRVNINGAYNLDAQKVIVREDESINSQSTIGLFNQLQDYQKIGLIYIICDNAKYYKSILINQYLEKKERIKLIFLPPYSPNLNVIERLWLFFKRKILYNKYIEKFITFKEKVMNFFETIDKYKNELSTMLTDNFHIITT